MQITSFEGKQFTIKPDQWYRFEFKNECSVRIGDIKPGEVYYGHAVVMSENPLNDNAEYIMYWHGNNLSIVGAPHFYTATKCKSPSEQLAEIAI